jgi:metal-responsive CopG/Arc/MetJ family transcriptional regulator
MEETENRKNRQLPAKYVRIEMSIPFPLLSQFDGEIERRGYNRSEAIRAAMRDQLERWTGRKL